jgi:hypothetical protein
VAASLVFLLSARSAAVHYLDTLNT